jgi:periplasmic protein TonB
MSIKIALVISLVIHAFVIAPFSRAALLNQPQPPKDQVTVDYFVLKEPEVKRAAMPQMKRAETARLDVAKNVDIKPAPTTKSSAPAQRKSASDRAEESARTETRIKNTKDYINYYQLIREQIRRRLKDNYKSYHGDGDVMLTFILNSNGSVSSVVIDPSASTDNKALQNIAVSSINEASPYPGFPKTLNLARMSFSLQISFKKQ